MPIPAWKEPDRVARTEGPAVTPNDHFFRDGTKMVSGTVLVTVMVVVLE